METAIFWLAILGPLIIGIAGCVYYGGSKVVAIWIGFAGCVFLLLAAALQWHQAIRSAEEEKTDPTLPYVSVSDAGIVTKPNDSAPTVFVVIKNSGQTPAYGVTWRAAFAVRNFPDIGVLDLDHKSVAAKFDLPPGNTLFYEWKFEQWGDGNWAAIKKGDVAILAFGEILYTDQSKSKKPRCTQYRLIHGGDSLAPEGKFGIAKEGNYTDGDCKGAQTAEQPSPN